MSDLGSDVQEDEVVEQAPARDTTSDDGWGSHETDAAPERVDITGDEEVRDQGEDVAQVDLDDGWGDDPTDLSEEGAPRESDELPRAQPANIARDDSEQSTEPANDDARQETGVQATDGATTEAEDQARRDVSDAVGDLPTSKSIEELLDDYDESTVPIDWHDIDMRSDENGVVLADNVPNARDIPPEREYFHLITHGSPRGLQANIDGLPVDLNLEQTAAIIEADPNWDHRPVRIFGCASGVGDFPERLAERLDVEVAAPTAMVDVTDPYLVEIGSPASPGYWKHCKPVR